MNRILQKLYENMGNITTEVVEETHTTFSKFDLEDYTEIIYEGKSGHGDIKAVLNLLKDAVGKGLVTVKETNSGWMVRSTKDNTQELIHKGERAFHYLRRYLQRLGY